MTGATRDSIVGVTEPEKNVNRLFKRARGEGEEDIPASSVFSSVRPEHRDVFHIVREIGVHVTIPIICPIDL